MHKTRDDAIRAWTDIVGALGLVLAVLVMVGADREVLRITACVLLAAAIPLAWHTLRAEWHRHRFRHWEREMTEQDAHLHP